MHEAPVTEIRTPTRQPWRWLAIGAAVLVVAAAFAWAGGWLTPSRLSPRQMVDGLQANAGVYPGFRRNHAKGICVAGTFESNGEASRYSKADLFKPGSTPLTGRFALPGGNPHAADRGVPIRSFALRFTQANGEQWRTGMNAMPVFAVATPQAFHEQTRASRPDPVTGKPDPASVAAFVAAHPETAAFRAWAKTAKPSASYATETYYGLNAFFFVDADGVRHPVRWRVVADADAATDAGATGGKDYLDADLERRLATGPLRWRLLVTLAEPGDPTDDATRTWPESRTTIDAGTVVLSSVQPEQSGACRNINFDPTVLPSGIEISDDPLLPARSAAYAESYLRRTGEQAHQPATSSQERTP